MKALILHPHVLAFRQLALKNDWFKNGSQSLVTKGFHPKEALEKCREGGEQLLNQLAAFALGMQCCGTVPVPTFDMLRFRFRLLASYGSGSVSRP